MRRDVFSTLHPVIGFIYFAFVILVTVFFFHPVVLGTSFFCALVYAVYLNGWKTLRFMLLGLVPMMLLAIAVNVLFNHRGATILFYFDRNPITLESIVFGSEAALMLGAVILWFSCYNAIMTSDKFLYLFGRIIPSLSIVFSMALRFVPRFKAQITRIADSQQAIGRSLTEGKVRDRAKTGMTILSTMVTWAFENAIETADSMRSRGFGLEGRTSYSLFRFETRDKALLALLAYLIVMIVLSIFLNVIFVENYPQFIINDMTLPAILIYAAFALVCAAPLLLDGIEALQWHYLKSKI